MEYTGYIHVKAYKNHIIHLMTSAEFNLHIAFLVKDTSTNHKQPCQISLTYNDHLHVANLRFIN